MKSILCLSGILCLFSLALLSCAHDDDSSDEGGDSRFASPQTVIYYMDSGNDVTVAASRSAARAAVASESESDSTTWDGYIENGELKPVASLPRRVEEDCAQSNLSGETSIPYIFLDIVKHEIYEAVGSVPFGTKQTFSTPVEAVRMDDVLSFAITKFEAQYTAATAQSAESALLYIATDVTYGGSFTFPVNAVIKCTPNAVGTLDVAFYYYQPNDSAEWGYVQFTVVSGTKTKLEYGHEGDDDGNENSYWETFDITSSAITGFHYNTEGAGGANKRWKSFSASSAYCAVYSARSEDNHGTLYNTNANGSVVRYKNLTSETDTWLYIVNYLSPDGYSVARDDTRGSTYSTEYYLTKTGDADTYPVFRNNKHKEYHYSLKETDFGDTFTCSVSEESFTALNESIKTNTDEIDAAAPGDQTSHAALAESLADWASS